MIPKERNLLSLRAEFHDKGKAARGLKNLRTNFLVPGREEQLFHLLRFHIPEGVRGEELIARFEIDALIECYNLMLIAALAGYVPENFDVELNKEIAEILGHPAVKLYVTNHYPYKLAEFTFMYVAEQRYFYQESTPDTVGIFNEFISLNRYLKNDSDIERFLGMLDFVWYENDTIAEVNAILSSFDRLNETFTAKSKTEAQKSVWGFMKFTTFISQLKELMLSSKDYPLLQSALWMFHGYYFDQIGSKMKDLLDEAFDNIESALNYPDLFKTITDELVGTQETVELDKDVLNAFASAAIQQARADTHFMLEKKWKDALETYFSTSSVNTPDKEPYKWDVFISYATEDRALVNKLAAQLSNRSITYWIDNVQIQSGDIVSDKINEGLAKSRIILAFANSDFTPPKTKATIQIMTNSNSKNDESSISISIHHDSRYSNDVEYHKKSFDVDEITLFIKELLTRNNDDQVLMATIPNDKLKIGKYEFFPSTRTLEGGGETVTLPAREAQLLYQLIQGRRLSREDILQKAWGGKDTYISLNIDSYIDRLRKYLAGDDRISIVSIQDGGFKLIEQTE